MELQYLNKEELIKEIEKYVLENYGKIEEFGDNANHYAFRHFTFLTIDTEFDALEMYNYYINEIYPQIKKDLNIDDNNRIIR